ncbi:hypothetical protein D3C73_501860 [compost metagenome]
MAQDLYDFPLRRSPAFRVIYNADNDLFPVNCTLEGLLWNKNIPVNPLIIRQHKTIGLQALEHTYSLQHPSFNDPHNFAFHTPAGRASRGNAHQHDIAVHRTLQIIGIQINIGMIAVIGNQKSKPLCMSLYTPAHQIHSFRYPIAGIPGQYHSSILLKCEQQFLERFERLAVL